MDIFYEVEHFLQRWRSVLDCHNAISRRNEGRVELLNGQIIVRLRSRLGIRATMGNNNILQKRIRGKES